MGWSWAFVIVHGVWIPRIHEAMGTAAVRELPGARQGRRRLRRSRSTVSGPQNLPLESWTRKICSEVSAILGVAGAIKLTELGGGHDQVQGRSTASECRGLIGRRGHHHATQAAMDLRSPRKIPCAPPLAFSLIFLRSRTTRRRGFTCTGRGHRGQGQHYNVFEFVRLFVYYLCLQK